RILHEGTMIEIWNKPRKGLGRPEHSAPMEKFLEVRRPQLQWQKELDLFQVGDQKGASLRMLKHLETYPSHRDIATWIVEFQAAVKGQIALPPPAGESEAPEEGAGSGEESGNAP
nr:hypothetical protein [Roseibacillus sp.]